MRSISVTQRYLSPHRVITHPSSHQTVRAVSNVINPKASTSLSKRSDDGSNGFGTSIVADSKLRIDVNSVQRLTAVLNLDIPKKILVNLSHYVPNFSKTGQKVSLGASEVIEATDTLAEPSADIVDDVNTREKKLVSEEKRIKETAQLRLKAHHAISREQHDFHRAMSDAFVSANSFPNTDEHTSSGKSKATVSTRSSTYTSLASTIAGGANIIKQISQRLPGVKSDSSQSPSGKVQKDEAMVRAILKRENLARSSAEKKTKGLVLALRASTTNISRLRRLEELCKHLVEHPNTKSKAVKEKAIPCLLKLRTHRDEAIKELAMEALALTGYVDPVKGRGIRILTLDGGGTRGLASIEILRKLQQELGEDLHHVFDYVCGVSTGSLIGIMTAVFRVPLDKTEELYKDCSSEMFSRNKLMGVGKLFMSHSYYDADVWEKILHQNIGFKSFLETTRDPQCPKVAAISSLMNVPKLQNFIFKNYMLPAGVQSHYPGSTEYKLWEAIRASSAAPGYFVEAKMGNLVHQDGGLLTNNPTAIAIHECKLLWPNDSIQCIVSVGTGKYEPTVDPDPADPNNLKNKLTKMVQSATDTEAVHSMLNDLLPPATYFRFNPYLSEEFELDEIRRDKWDQMKHDTLMYCRKNEHKIKLAASTLLKTKLPHQKIKDHLKLKRDTLL